MKKNKTVKKRNRKRRRKIRKKFKIPLVSESNTRANF
jgi:hypothetical protein